MRAEEAPAFTAVAKARYPAMRRTAYTLCGDWHLADDLVQRSLIKLFGAWPLKDSGVVDAWLVRTLFRTYIDETRRPWWRHERHPGSGDIPDRPALEADTGLDDGLLRQLDALPPRQRACLVLRFLEDYSDEQTADALGVSVGTVKASTSRGLAAMRRQLATPERNQP